MSDQRIEPLNAAELRWVAAEVGNAQTLVQALCPADAGRPLTPQILDRAYKAARTSAGTDATNANAIINAVGMAFGQCLVDQLGFQWVAVFDQQGSEVAVVALPGQADVVVFPPNLVAKRWSDGTVDFLSDVYHGITDELQWYKQM